MLAKKVKRVLKVIGGNIVVLIELLVVFEIILRLAGAQTIFQMERGPSFYSSSYRL